MEIDEVFNKIGEFGRSQKKIFFLMNIANVLAAFHVLIFTFIAEEPVWVCAKSEDASQPIRTACEMIARGECVPDYLTDYYSIIEQWDLICGKSNYPKLSQSAFFVGSLLGAWVWGIISDKIGRRKVYFITAAFVVLSSLGCALSFNYYVFVLSRICLAFSISGLILSTVVIGVEMVGASARSFTGIAGGGIFALGYPLLAVLAYFFRNWRVLVFITSGLTTILFALIKVIPESPRWLLVNGRKEEARAILEDIAQGNGTIMPQGELRLASSSSGSVGMYHLFSNPVVRKRTALLLIVWFTECMVYYALAMSAGEFGGNKYLSFAFSGLVEVPSVLLAYKMLNRLGRRWTHGGFLISAGVACLSWTAIYWAGSGALGVPVALLGKFAVAGAFNVVYLYTAELYPTEVRNAGLGVSSIGARLGGIFAPIVLMTVKYDRGLPMFIMGLLALGTGLISMLLPETLNKPMPDTLRDLEGLG